MIGIKVTFDLGSAIILLKNCKYVNFWPEVSLYRVSGRTLSLRGFFLTSSRASVLPPSAEIRSPSLVSRERCMMIVA